MQLILLLSIAAVYQLQHSSFQRCHNS